MQMGDDLDDGAGAKVDLLRADGCTEANYRGSNQAWKLHDRLNSARIGILVVT
jgi:hypothetical protein